MAKLKNYLFSFSTQLGWLMGFLYYIAYATPSHAWSDPYLITVSIFIAFFAPYYSRFSNKIDETLCFYTASIFSGKLARFLAQYIFNIVIFFVLLQGQAINSQDLARLGGILGIAFLMSLTSQGIQYLALAFFNRDIGSKNLNITLGVMFNVLIGAFAAQGFMFAQYALEILGISLSIAGLLYSLYTDIRGISAPKGGIGLFFGTFNPAHKTHAKMLKDFIRDRQLDKVIIHPTLIPKVHCLALEKGQIRIKQKIDGMRIYETTEKADVHVNYFLTGNKFYEVEHRLNMLKAIVKEENLEDKIEVWNLSEAYQKDGFYAVVAAIKKKFPGVILHGMHGSDVGGMLVRAIYDESFGIFPYAVKRIDGVSATAIRRGAKGMTTQGVEEYLLDLKGI